MPIASWDHDGLTGTGDARLSVENVTVEFGPTRALDDVTLSFRPGEIIGLLGHNGAGKSTLFNVLSGVYSAARGRVSLDGTPLPAHLTPRDAARHGIIAVHQEPALAANLSVVDNLNLGARLPRRQLRDTARGALDQVGCTAPLDVMVEALPLGQRQLVDLARGFMGDRVRLLLLDEPTAALGRTETEALHRLIKDLSEQGVTIIYVSHRLPDILDVCQRIVVLRSGRVVEDRPTSHFTGRSLAKALAPDITDDQFEAKPTAHDAPEFSYDGITARAGEVVGLFGMAAGEQFDLLTEIFGLDGRCTFRWGGDSVTVTSPRSAVARGLHLVPPDRERDGLVSGASALETVYVPWYRRMSRGGWWIGRTSGADQYAAARAQLNILGPDHQAPINEFSGGNRQKHLLSRWMFPARPEILLLAQPTQGVDVGAKRDIARAVRALAAEGVLVLVASAESDEIVELCDRAVVMFHGARAHVARSEDFNGLLVSTLLELSDVPQPLQELH